MEPMKTHIRTTNMLKLTLILSSTMMTMVAMDMIVMVTDMIVIVHTKALIHMEGMKNMTLK